MIILIETHESRVTVNFFKNIFIIFSNFARKFEFFISKNPWAEKNKAECANMEISELFENHIF